MDHLADAPIANILILAGVVFLAVGLFGRIGGFIGSIFGNIEAGKNSRVLAGVLGVLLIVGGVWMHQQSDRSAASHATPAANAPATTAASAPAPTATTTPSVTPAAGDPAKGKPAADPAANEVHPSATPAVSPATGRGNAASSQPAHVGDPRLVRAWANVIPAKGNTVAKIEVVRSAQGLDAHIWNACNTGVCDYGVHSLAVSGNTSTYDFTNGDRHFVGTMNVYAPNILLLSVDSYEPGTSNHWHHTRVLSNPDLSGKIQVAFSRYLDSPGPKAFAMTPAGAYSFQLKANTVEEAAKTALQHCEDHGWRDCRIILLNDEGPQ